MNQQAKSDLTQLSTKDVNALRKVAQQAPGFTSVAQLQAAVAKASPQTAVLAAKYAQRATQEFNQLNAKLAPKSKAFFAQVSFNLQSKIFNSKCVKFLDC